MSRIPHLYLPPPWPEGVIPLLEDAAIHLRRVLRLGDFAAVTYTDGAGVIGSGTLGPDGIARGVEALAPPPAVPVSVAVAAPRRRERIRLLVEKLAELGVERLTWLATRRGEGLPPRRDRAEGWAAAALEQSGGARLLAIDGPVEIDGLGGTLLAGVRGGDPFPAVAGPATLLVGPEGGWAEGELPPGTLAVGLGENTLRTETAAIVMAVLALRAGGRLGAGPSPED